MATVIDELVALLRFDLRGENEVRKFNAALDKSERNATAWARNMGRIAGVAAAAVAGGMIKLGMSVIDTSAQFEQFETTLTTIEGSQAKAKQSMGWIKDFTEKTPFDLAGVTEGFVKLKAYGIDPIANDALRTLGDTASAMSKPLNQAVEALADASTMEFERLKEFGLKAKQAGNEVTFTWSKNGKDLTKTLKKNGSDIRNFILENFSERFGGAMEMQSKTWKGMLSNLGDAWTNFKNDIGEAGFFEFMKDQLREILDVVQQFKDDGTLKEWAKSISDVLKSSAEFSIGFAKSLKNNFDTIRNLSKDFPNLIGPLKAGLAILAALTFPKTFALIMLQDLLTWMGGEGGSLIESFAAQMHELTGFDTGALERLSVALGVLGTGMILIGGKFAIAAAGIFLFITAVKALSDIGGIEGMRDSLYEKLGAPTPKQVMEAGAEIGRMVPKGPKKSSVPQFPKGSRVRTKPDANASGVSDRFGDASNSSLSGRMKNLEMNFGKVTRSTSAIPGAVTNNNNNSQTNHVENNVNVNVTSTEAVPESVASAVGSATAQAIQPPARNTGPHAP